MNGWKKKKEGKKRESFAEQKSRKVKKQKKVKQRTKEVEWNLIQPPIFVFVYAFCCIATPPLSDDDAIIKLFFIVKFRW